MGTVRTRGYAGGAKHFRRPDPLVKEMEKILEEVLETRRKNGWKLIPDVDFLLEHLEFLLEYRTVYLGDKRDRWILLVAITEAIDVKRQVGKALDFSEEVLDTLARTIAKNTPNIQEVKKWKSKVSRRKAGEEREASLPEP